MISPEEIRKKALAWWKPYLLSVVNGDPFFPKTITRIGKVKPGDITKQFESLQKKIHLLRQHSKSHTGSGFSIIDVEQNFRRTGTNELPDSIVFETVEDYISFLGKDKEYSIFLRNLNCIRERIPQLGPWVKDNCLWLTDSQIHWPDILAVCLCFLGEPRPNMYIRQLPVQVHTKFIEENASVLQSLLDFLIPGHIRNAQSNRFAERYYLKYDEPLIRMRLLDSQLTCFMGFRDVSIPLSAFEKSELPVRNILITENKMNFLTLPAFPSGIAIWSGGGFNVSHLKNASWLAGKNILYWGDIDEHGFQILNQLRSYYPNVRSIMMDSNTFERHIEASVVGVQSNSENFYLLSQEEEKLFNLLKIAKLNRLEQEKIPQTYVESYLAALVQPE